MVHKLEFRRALVYILPQLVCLQYSRGQIFPSLMIKEAKENLQGVRNMRSMVQRVTLLCNTGPSPLTKTLDSLGNIFTLNAIKAQLLAHCLSPKQAYQQLLAIIAQLPMQPRMTEVAAEAALRKLTWRLPFIFASAEDGPCTLSRSEAMRIYRDQNDLCKSQVTECTNQFKSPTEALQAITNHVHTRFTKQDPTLFQSWSQLMPILAGEVQELIEALHSKETQAIIDEPGDVLYVASYGLRFSTEVQGELAVQVNLVEPDSPFLTKLRNSNKLPRQHHAASTSRLWWSQTNRGVLRSTITRITMVSHDRGQPHRVTRPPPWTSVQRCMAPRGMARNPPGNNYS